jgi:hypothetical protein
VSWVNHDTGTTADVLYGGPIYYKVCRTPCRTTRT